MQLISFLFTFATQNITITKLPMLGVEEKDPVITGKYADDLYEEYKSVYGEPVYSKSKEIG